MCMSDDYIDDINVFIFEVEGFIKKRNGFMELTVNSNLD